MAARKRTLRSLVETRARMQCEYCRRYQTQIGKIFFEVEHILPRSRGGLTTPQNLALACRRCNLYKGNTVELADMRTGRIAPLFNPRYDEWHQHFRRSRDLLRIYGRTATGRITVKLLKLNDDDEQDVRRVQRDYLAHNYPLE